MINNSQEQHVLFCSNESGNNIIQTGTDAERMVVSYLVENLNIYRVGNFRILVNYNLPFRNAGGRGTLEVDIIVIDKYGVFTIEVKNWSGIIEAYDGYWLQNQKYKHSDVFASIEQKSRILHGYLSNKKDSVNLSRISVTPLIVLALGKRNFVNNSRFDSAKVLGIDNDLILALSTDRLLFKGQSSRSLNNDEIEEIANTLYNAKGEKHEEIIGHYRKIGELSPGDLFSAYEGVHVDIPSMHVRIKAYTLQKYSGKINEQAIKQIRHGALAVSKLISNPHILETKDFFEDPSRPDKFYEITEMVQGERLDDFLKRFLEKIPLQTQLEAIKQLCDALECAHEKKVYHRNISPETIFINNNGNTLKLADFDFAKIVGNETISTIGEILVDNEFTAPEVILNPSLASPASDIFSLGIVWFYLALHPKKGSYYGVKSIDLLDLPPNHKDLIRRMTDHAPDNRPQSIRKLLKRLNELDKSIVSS